MRIALILRGINYTENYLHRDGKKPHHINFMDVANTVKSNVIQSFSNMGHTVDVFVHTYYSNKMTELLEFYKPVKSIFTSYRLMNIGSDQEGVKEPMLIERHLEIVNMVEHYEKDFNFNYDAIVITRLDLYFYKAMHELQLDFSCVNIPFWHIARPHNAANIFSSEDNFIFLPRDKIDIYKQCLENMKKNKNSTHYTGKYLLDKGETIKYLYGEKGDGAYDYPIYKFARDIFGEARVFLSPEDNIKVPLNRIYHSEEEKLNPQPIYVKW